MHVRRLFAVVEEKQIAGARANFGVGADAAIGQHLAAPVVDAFELECAGIEPVGLAALVKRGQCHAGVHDHVGGRAVAQATASAPARAQSQRGFVDQPSIQSLACGFFLHEGLGADEAVSVFAAAMLKAHHVQHAIAIEQVVGAKRLVHRVLRVAQIHPVQAFWDFTNDLQVGGIPFLVVGCERPGHQRMLVWHQSRPGFRNEFSVHRWLYVKWPRAYG